MGTLSFEQVLQWALAYGKQANVKVYVYGYYLITSQRWIYTWASDANYVARRKAERPNLTYIRGELSK